MFVEQEQLGAPVGSHEQGERLPLAPGEAADRVVEAVLQSHPERPDPVAELGDLAPGHRPSEAAGKAPPGRQGEVLGDGERRRSAGQRILKDPADQPCAAMLRPVSDLPAGQSDRAGIDPERPGDRVQGRALARAVGPDHDDEALRLDRQVDTPEGADLVGGAGVERLEYSVQLEQRHDQTPQM